MNQLFPTRIHQDYDSFESISIASDYPSENEKNDTCGLCFEEKILWPSCSSIKCKFFICKDCFSLDWQMIKCPYCKTGRFKPSEKSSKVKQLYLGKKVKRYAEDMIKNDKEFDNFIEEELFENDLVEGVLQTPPYTPPREEQLYDNPNLFEQALIYENINDDISIVELNLFGNRPIIPLSSRMIFSGIMNWGNFYIKAMRYMIFGKNKIKNQDDDEYDTIFRILNEKDVPHEDKYFIYNISLYYIENMEKILNTSMTNFTRSIIADTILKIILLMFSRKVTIRNSRVREKRMISRVRYSDIRFPLDLSLYWKIKITAALHIPLMVKISTIRNPIRCDNEIDYVIRSSDFEYKPLVFNYV